MSPRHLPISTLHLPLSPRHVAFVGVLMAALAAKNLLAADVPLQSLALEHFRDTAIVNDDPVNGLTTVTTQKGFVEHHGLLGAVWDDEFLSGTVDRKNSTRSFEVIATITYRGQRRFYGVASFTGENGPIMEPASQLKTSSVNCPTGECTYTDQVSFAVEEGLLRKLAAATADRPSVWHFTLRAKSSADYAGGLSSAEIGGFLAKVDEFTGAAPPRPVAQALLSKPELGIGSLRVEATEQQPDRSGVLVTAVRSGSVAAKAGLIVGDILRAINGHPLQNPADIQAAIAASPSHGPIEIELFRGLKEITLTGQL